MHYNLENFIPIHQQKVIQQLEQILPAEHILPVSLHRAMRYSTLSTSKRIRPVLVYATGYALNISDTLLHAPACAVELIHSYSLIHDDLPCMDDDDLRRGQASCHKAFDEATALLAGDALQSLAFQVLVQAPLLNPEQKNQMLEILTIASGSKGMVGGQAIDLAAVNKTLNIAELENMHIHKTGALIRASVKLGALSKVMLDSHILHNLDQYAKNIGLAFQVMDDILDIESSTDILGKPQGSDRAKNKPTYPELLGLSGAHELALSLHNQAIQALSHFDQRADPLRWIADYIIQRKQ